MEKLLIFVQSRLKEPSTWYGIMLISASFGMEISPEKQTAIIYFGMAMAGAPDVNLANVLKGIFGKNAVVETPKADPVTPVTVKETKTKAKENPISDILDDDASL